MVDLRLLVGFPVLARPANAPIVLESLRSTAPTAEFVFLCSGGDGDELVMCQSLGWTEIIGGTTDPGQFARKHNLGFQLAVDEGYDWYFVGADDLRFHPGWLEECLRQHEKTEACVIGTNDLGNPRTRSGRHSTHFLVHRDYLECGTIDEPGKLFVEAYQHEFVDDEAVQTAQFRGTYAHAYNAIVEHLHPDWGKADRDATYEKAQAGRSHDQALYHRRRHLWTRTRSGVR